MAPLSVFEMHFEETFIVSSSKALHRIATEIRLSCQRLTFRLRAQPFAAASFGKSFLFAVGSVFARATAPATLPEHEDRPAAKRRRIGDAVHLNVGGCRFETSASTLRQCRFFRCMLGGNFGDGTDADGSIFVDRDGELFAHILAWLRSKQRPSRSVLATKYQALVAECQYFGLDALLDELEGRISYSDMRVEDSNTQIENAECCAFFADLTARSKSEEASQLQSEMRLWERRLLIPVFERIEEFCRRDPAELGLPLLFAPKDEVPALNVQNMENFEHAFDKLTGGLFKTLRSLPGLVFAGGAVMGALTGVKAGDLDIFLVGEGEEYLGGKVLEIIRRVQSLRRVWRVTRTDLAITLFFCNGEMPAQIILAAFRSPLEVIANFDIDCCCCAYCTTSCKFFCTPRARRSICYRTNITDTSLRTLSYESRLEKYAHRGFAVGIPGLKEHSLDLSMFEAKYLHDDCFDILLRLDGLPVKLQPPQTRSFHTLNGGWSDGKPSLSQGTACDVEIKSEQRARSIHGLQRLLIMDEARTRGRGGVEIHKEFATFARRNMEDLKPEIMFATRASDNDGEYIVLTTENARDDSGGLDAVECSLVRRWMQTMKGDSNFDGSEPRDGKPQFLYGARARLFETTSDAASHCMSDGRPLGFLFWRGPVTTDDFSHDFFKLHERQLGWHSDESFKRFFGVNTTIQFPVGSPNYIMARQLQMGHNLKKRDFWANVYT